MVAFFYRYYFYQRIKKAFIINYLPKNNISLVALDYPSIQQYPQLQIDSAKDSQRVFSFSSPINRRLDLLLFWKVI